MRCDAAAEPSPEPEAAPTSEAQVPAVPENGLAGTLPPADYRRLSDYWMERTRLAEAEVYALREQLAQLRARVAILDAQKVELPELKPYRGWLSDATRERERQLLDALRAIQAWREVAQALNQATVRAERKLRAYVGVCKGDKELTQTILPMLNDAIAAYDALAGKGE